MPGGKSGGGPNGGGNNGNDGDHGDKGGREKSLWENKYAEPENNLNLGKSRVLMWFLLLIVLMTFGGLISAYVVLATNAALEWRPFELPFQVWISTALILLSSVTYDAGKRAFKADRAESAHKWFLTTTALGGMFVSSQILTWLALVDRGLYMSGNPYAGFFYILTGVHAVHVIGGMFALGYVVLKTRQRTGPGEGRAKLVTDVTSIGWYWHTMDLLWLVLLFLLGFWK
ncbi:MAG: cytochrome c oxidase subunit 3 [Acidobacteriota bacterium]|nr:cytochrome c oxidase subunit 3 [Acidobacteriota bacterium]